MNGWKTRKEGDVLNVGRLLMLNLLRFRRRASERARRVSRGGEASEHGDGANKQMRRPDPKKFKIRVWRFSLSVSCLSRVTSQL